VLGSSRAEIRKGAPGDAAAEDDVTVGDGDDRPDDLLLARSLDQIAAGTGTHGGEEGLVVVEHREHDDGDPRRRRPELTDRVEAGRPRHPQIHEDDVSLLRDGDPDGIAAVRGLTDHLDALDAGQRRSQPVAEDGVIVGDDDAQAHAGSEDVRAPIP